MGFLYFDESIHDRAGFALGAIVFSRGPLEAQVADTLRRVGLHPGADEFKSGGRVPTDSTQARVHTLLRSELGALPERIGLVVAPSANRHRFGTDALAGIYKILMANDLPGPHTLYLDQGIFASPGRAKRLARSTGLGEGVTVVAEADSRTIGGIQVADIVAHALSTMLLQQLGRVSKTVKAGPNSGHDPESNLDIGFVLWAGLRHRFFRRPFASVTEDDPRYDRRRDVASCGLYVSDRCAPELREAAHARFGSVWLGCIH